MILCLMALLAAVLPAQTPTPYDCQQSATFTASTLTTASYYNRGPAAPCVSWRLTYHTQSATGVSISLQGTGNLANGQPDPAGWTNLTVTAPVTNPATGTAAGTIAACCDYYPWIRAIATTFTGTGQTMKLAVFGYKGTSAARTTGGGGGGTVTAVTATSPIVSSNGTTPAISLDTTKVPQKFFGTAAPGSVATNLPGDLFTDTTAHNEYVCGAPSGTAAPACTTVSAGGWLLVNNGAALTPPVTFTDIATPTAPSPGNTAWYTKGGKLCSLSPAAVEACTGGGGGGGTITSGSITTLPASPASGQLYLPTDSVYEALIYTGSAWEYHFRGTAATPPNNSTFALFNNGDGKASVAAQTNGAITLTCTTNGSADSIHAYEYAAPGTPWSAVFRLRGIAFTNYNNSGISLRESITGKIETFGLSFTGTGNASLQIGEWTNATTFYTSVYTINAGGFLSGDLDLTLRVSDTGISGNLTWEFSADNGISFTTLATQSRTTFFTAGPDKIGIYINANTTGSGTQPNSLTLISIN